MLASSGKQRWVHWRWACPKFLRQTFQEWAVHSLASCAWAKDYYQQQRAKGKPGNTVVRALAYKWIRILFRCWKDRTPYCESTYLETLERRRRFAPKASPVLLTITSFSRWNESRQAAFGMNMLTVALEAAVTAVRMGHPFLETL